MIYCSDLYLFNDNLSHFVTLFNHHLETTGALTVGIEEINSSHSTEIFVNERRVLYIAHNSPLLSPSTSLIPKGRSFSTYTLPLFKSENILDILRDDLISKKLKRL
jgi:hypothetical protein